MKLLIFWDWRKAMNEVVNFYPTISVQETKQIDKQTEQFTNLDRFM